MSKGSYTIGQSETKDSSFKSCMCALLIFIALCLIIFLVGFLTWKYSGNKKDKKEDMEFQELHGIQRMTPKVNEKMIYDVITSTKQPITSEVTTTPTTTSTTVKSPISSEDKREIEPNTTTPLTTMSSTIRTTTSGGNITTTVFPSSKTTLETTTDYKTMMPIDVRYMTDKNNVTTTESAKETITTTSRTTTPEYVDTMEVLEATGFDIIDEPSDTETTTFSTTINVTTQKAREPILTTTKVPEEPVCLTAGCKSVASHILSFMNHSIDPCEDFYEFACGGMQVGNDNSDAWRRLWEQIYLINDTSPKYLQTYKTFYDSCVSHDYIFDYDKRTAKVRKLVTEVGTIRDDAKGSEDIDMTEIFAKLILRRSLLILDIDLDIDKQSSKFIMKLAPPGFTSVLTEGSSLSESLTDLQRRCLDRQKRTLNEENVDLNTVHSNFIECQKDYSVLLHSIETAVASLGFYSHWNNTFNKTQAIQDLRTTVEWDVLEHLNVLPPPNEIRETVLLKEYTVMNISQLQKKYPYLEWKRLLKILTDTDFEDDTPIQVYFPDYFEELFSGLQSQPTWKINNALIAVYANRLYETLVIPTSKQGRERYCLHIINKLFRDISSNLYLKTWTKENLEQIQNFLTNIFDTIKKTLAKELKAADWLDSSSKVSMLVKAKKMTLTFNKLEDSYNNEEHLNAKYKDVRLDVKDYIQNVIDMMEFERKKLYGITGELYTVDYLWSYFVNIFNNFPTSFYTERLIMAPLGMMKGPVRGYPGYITMSRIGLSLAREIGHHFDPVGIQNDMILSEESKTIYDEMVTVIKNDNLMKASDKRVKNQKVSYEASPNLSANNRIADNTGTRLITDYLRTLKAENNLPWISTTFSKEKIFFISIAQEYCQVTNLIDYMLALYESEILPPSLQVENIVTNSVAFARIFACPEGSLMNNNPVKMQFPNLIQDANISTDDSQAD